jgi:hypothetical protein
LEGEWVVLELISMSERGAAILVEYILYVACACVSDVCNLTLLVTVVQAVFIYLKKDAV